MGTVADKPSTRIVRPGVPLAVVPTAIHRGADGFFLLLGKAPTPANERIGDVAVVYLHGPLEHHDDAEGDSYDALLARMRDAFDGGEDGPPKAVVMRVDSVGGVVSGLNETVMSLRRLRERAGIPLFAFVDELAASAAYAICCAADEIILPRSAILGSVGTISTMVSQARADAKAGLDFAILTSGARKADGHVHAPLSPAAQAAELRRVNRLAAQFFGLVSGARHISTQQLQEYEAGLFLGKEALIAGLADAVDGWESALADIALVNSAQLGASSTQRAQSGASGQGEEPMSKVTLAALVKRTEAQLAKEKDPEKKKVLTAALASYKGAEAAFKKTISHKETHEGDADSENDDSGKDDDDSGGDSDEEEEESEEAEGNETVRKEGDEEEDDEEEESEEEAAKSESEEKKAAKALLPTLRSLTGRQNASAVLGVLRSTFARAAKYDTVVADVRKLKADQARSRINALVERGVRDGKLAPAQARFWRGQKDEAQLKAYLDVTPKGAIVRTQPAEPALGIDGEAFAAASGAIPGEGLALNAQQQAMMQAAMSAAQAHGVKDVKPDDFLAAARAVTTNGEGRRY